jgi:hypothetical protein
MKIIEKSQQILVEQYFLVFLWVEDPNAGFSFPCTPDGALKREEMKLAALENYRKCTNGDFNVIAYGVRDNSYTYRDPAVGQCQCGCRVTLDRDTTCACGREYNRFGQLLAPQSQWREW